MDSEVKAFQLQSRLSIDLQFKLGAIDRADIADRMKEYYNLSLWFLFGWLKGAEGGAWW